MKKLEQRFQHILFIEMVYSVIYALLGLIIFFHSEMTNRVVGIYLGMFFIFRGGIAFFSYSYQKKNTFFKYHPFVGVISILLGLFIIFNPLSFLDFLNIFFGLWLILEGINKMIYFFILKKIQESSCKIIFASSIFFFLLGVLILINPFRSIVITKTVGIFIMLYNILNINDLVLLKRRGKYFLELFK